MLHLKRNEGQLLTITDPSGKVLVIRVNFIVDSSQSRTGRASVQLGFQDPDRHFTIHRPEFRGREQQRDGN